MTTYHVHLYREMRLVFGDIEADTPEMAATIARDKPTNDADAIEDCEGENLAALIDVAGDDEYEQSVIVDFEGERVRIAAPKLLDVLRWITCCPIIPGPVGTTAYIISDEKMAQARAAVAEAELSGIALPPGEADIHALLDQRQQIALIWGLDDVRTLRPDLNDEQCWEVLQDVDRHKDAGLGISWFTLESAAESLFGDAPETGEA